MEVLRGVLKIILCITIVLPLKASYGMLHPRGTTSQNEDLTPTFAILDFYYPCATLRELVSIAQVLNCITCCRFPTPSRNDQRSFWRMVKLFHDNSWIIGHLQFITLRDTNDQPITAARRACERPNDYCLKFNETFGIPRSE
jgi:hypothetical protein